MVVRLNRIVTVPHCYVSVVLNTLEISIEVGVRVEVKFIVTGEGTRVTMRSSMEVNRTTRTKVTPIITCNTRAMGADAIVETMGGTTDSVSLVDFREAMGTRGRDVDMRAMRRSGLRCGRKTRTRSDTRASGRGIAMTLFVTPFTTIVACAMEGRPETL